MTLKQIVERVQQLHPDMGAQEIVSMVNDAQDEFITRTKLIADAVKFDLTKDQRGYGLTDNIMEIKSVDYDGKLIKKLIGRPEVRDLS